MANATVILTKPAVTHGPPVHKLEFRPPRYRDLMDFGEPFTIIPVGETGWRKIDDFEVIDKYAQRLIVDGDKRGDPDLLERLCLEDAEKVKGVIIAFFLGAAPEPSAGSSTSPTTSSSSLDGDQPTSKT